MVEKYDAQFTVIPAATRKTKTNQAIIRSNLLELNRQLFYNSALPPKKSGESELDEKSVRFLAH